MMLSTIYMENAKSLITITAFRLSFEDDNLDGSD